MRSFTKCLAIAAMVLATSAVGAGELPTVPFCDRDVINWCVCISRDGKSLAKGGWFVWDIPSGKRVLSGEMRCACTMAFSPDGDLLAASGGYSDLFVYDAHTGKVVWDLTLVGHGNTIIDHLEFTSDGRYLVSSSYNGMLRVWNLRDKKAQALYCFASKYEVNNGYKEYLKAWQALAGNKPPDGVTAFVVFDKPIQQLQQFSLSPDGKSVAVALGESDVLLLELETGKLLKTFHTDQVSNISVRFSQDGKMLAVGGADEKQNTGKCTIEVWDVPSGKRLATCPGHRHSVLHMAISPDNKTIVSGGTYDGVRVWDAATGKAKFALYQDEDTRVEGVEFLPDGKSFLTAASTCEPNRPALPVHFWDTATGERVSPIEKKQSK